MKLRKILAALLFVPFVFASCENYDEDERLKLIEGGETTDSTPITKEQSDTFVRRIYSVELSELSSRYSSFEYD